MIKSIHLHNFKCFLDQSIELGNLTLLTGLNGMGKSSVLQSLLRQSYQQGLLPMVGLELNGDLLHVGTAQDALAEGASEDDVLGFYLTLHDGVNGMWKFKYSGPEADLMDVAEAAVDPEMWRSSLFADDFHYLQAERIGPRASNELSEYLVRRHRQLGIRGEYTAHFLSAFGRTDSVLPGLCRQDEASDKLQDQVEAWMGEISPGVRLDLTAHSSMDLISLRYTFVTRHQVSNRYRPTNVGFGITYTLPVVVAILSAKPGSLLILENPEAHLHPRGQALMGELMARAAAAQVQVLLETHSDHVLNGIRVAVHDNKIDPDLVRIHFFTRIEKEDQSCSVIVSPNLDRNGRIDNWPINFFDEWDRNLDILLEPREE